MAMRAINPAHLVRLLDSADSDSLPQGRRLVSALLALAADSSLSPALLRLGSRLAPQPSVVAQEAASSDRNRKVPPSSAVPRQPQPHHPAVCLAQVAVALEVALLEDSVVDRLVPTSSDSRINSSRNQRLADSEVARLVASDRRLLVDSAVALQALEGGCSEAPLLLRPRSVNSRTLEPHSVASGSRATSSKARRAEASLGHLDPTIRTSSKSRACLVAQLRQRVRTSLAVYWAI